MDHGAVNVAVAADVLAPGFFAMMQLREPAAHEWADAEHLHPFAHELMLLPQDNVLRLWRVQPALMSDAIEYERGLPEQHGG